MIQFIKQQHANLAELMDGQITGNYWHFYCNGSPEAARGPPAGSGMGNQHKGGRRVGLATD